MIYLKSKKILLIKPLKTASTSLEVAFACNATPEDIVTPMSINYELMRLNMGAQLPINYSFKPSVEKRYRAKVHILNKLHSWFPSISVDTLEKLINPILRSRGRKRFFNHIKPTQIAEIMGDDFLRESFVVTMCRHPYEVLVSRVYWEQWKKHRSQDFDVSTTIDRMLIEKEPLNLDYYFHKGEYVPQFVIRYEHLNEDIEKLEKMFDLKLTENMPFTKNKVRKSENSAQAILTERQKELCYLKNKPIFDIFGYEK